MLPHVAVEILWMVKLRMLRWEGGQYLGFSEWALVTTSMVIRGKQEGPEGRSEMMETGSEKNSDAKWLTWWVEEEAMRKRMR